MDITVEEMSLDQFLKLQEHISSEENIKGNNLKVYVSGIREGVVGPSIGSPGDKPKQYYHGVTVHVDKDALEESNFLELMKMLYEHSR